MSTEKKLTMLKGIAAGASGSDMAANLFNGGVPKFECEFWDYKLLVKDDAESLAELCRDIISFYNSFGGLIVVGVDDSSNLVGCADLPFDEKQLKLKIRNYCGHDVVVRVEKTEVAGCPLVCICVPKRPAPVPVAVITADGPQIKNKPAFRRGAVYFRSDESCQLIRNSDDMKFLSSDRQHALEAVRVSSYVPHNLPDRSMICEQFVGRTEVKQELWMWLSDRMARYRVLAGPGGFGKTSAAYSFCEDLVESAPLGFMQVVWLSAKSKQFDASRDQFVKLAYAGNVSDSFSDVTSLLEAIAHHLPVTTEELQGLAEPDVVQVLQRNLEQIPSFFVIDDIDSLSPDEQRRVVEIAMLLGGERARFLLTMRKNYIAPSTSMTVLPGLDGAEFRQYVGVLEKRYGREIPASSTESLKAETGGSPLFVESVFRLLKLGERFADAMTRWKGQDGEAVRAAAFRKEVEQLSFNAKRTLFAIAQFPSLSSVEIRKVAELEQPQVEGALIELEQLFLLSSEQIGDEARFSVPTNIARLLIEHKEELIPTHKEIARRSAIHRQSSGVKGKSRGKSQFVGKVIAQAMVQVGEDPHGALVAIRSAMKADKSNADLWMVYARCLSAARPLDVEAVRQAFAKSYSLQKRERDLFDKWIEFENEHGNSNAAVDVAEKAAPILVPPPWDWLVKVAAAYYKRGTERQSRLEGADADSDFKTAADMLAKALRFSPSASKSSVSAALARATSALHREA